MRNRHQCADRSVGHVVYEMVFAPQLATNLRGDVTAGPAEPLFEGVPNRRRDRERGHSLASCDWIGAAVGQSAQMSINTTVAVCGAQTAARCGSELHPREYRKRDDRR